MSESPETIHALIVGIDDYGSSPLQGCVNDALAVGTFFEQYSSRNGFQRNFKYLLAPQDRGAQAVSDAKVEIHAPPTRDNIIAAFTEFSDPGATRAGDVFLFYFSGHGSQETAAPEFRHLKADGLDEALDCLDKAEGERRHLLDKELAWLLSRLNPDLHLLVITDCCHSGNNTRGDDDLIQIRRGKPRAAFTPYQQLLGVKDVPEADRIFTIHNEKAYYRNNAEARHIHLAAARDNETAKETMIEGRRRGVFTWSLLRVLENGGTGLSYLELLRRTESYVRNRVAEQIPQLEAIGGAGKTDGFLGGAFPPARPEYPVQYAAQQWRLLAGRLNGIVPGSWDIPAWVTLNDRRMVRINSVEANYSILDDAGFTHEDRDNAGLLATVTQMPAAAIRVYVDADEAPRQELKATIKKINPAYVDFGGASEADAEFTARQDAKKNWMLLRKDSAFPVFLRQPESYEFVQFCDAVGKYRFVLELENADTRIDLNDLEIELEVIEGQALSLENLNTLKGKPGDRNDLTLYYRWSGGKRLQPALRCKLRFRQKSLWVGGLFLDNEFGITHNLASRELMPGQEHAFAFSLRGTEYNAVPLSIKKELLDRGVSEITDYLKIFVSNTDFKLDDFAQTALPLDQGGTTRSIELEEEAPVGTKTDWAVITIPVRVVCPPQVASAQELAVQDFTIVPPPGFTAQYALSSLADVHRKLNTAPLERSEAAGLQKYLLPPPSLWGDGPVESQVFSRAIELRSGSDTAPSVLELADVSGELKAPLVLNLREKPADDEAVISIGYDPETELYFPAGFTNSEGNIEIFALPPETPGQIYGDANLSERNVKRSVKLFFRKLIRREAVNTLTLVRNDLSISEDAGVIRTAVAGARNILLLTHGIFGNTEDKKAAVMQATDIHRHYDAVLAFEYENLNTDLRETARDLFGRLKKAGVCEGDKPRLTIVAPSMGGLVCRWMIEVEEAAPWVKHLVMVATPNLGSDLAPFRQRIFGLLGKALNGVALLKPYLTPLSFLAKKADKAFWRTLNDLHPTESRFLAELNAKGNLPATVRYSLLGGNLEGITPSDAGNGNYWLNLKKYAAKTALDWLVFEGAHDMAVEVDSQKGTRWLRPENTVIVPVDHLSYFVEKEGLEALKSLLADP